MMRTLNFILAFFIFGLLNSQTVQVNYTLTTNKNNHHLSKRGDYQLTANKENSLFEPLTNDPRDLYKKDPNNIETIWVKDNLYHVNLSQGVTDFSFRDIYYTDTNYLFYNKILFNEIAFIKEDFGLFEWQIIGDTKTILGYECKKAVSQFRGRLYEAYFTTELNFKSGPWKFHGLPGLILSVRSVDNYFSITATSIKIKENTVNIDNPFKNKDYLNINQYKKNLKAKYLKMLRAFKSKQPTDPEGGGSIEVEFNDEIEDLGLETIKFSY